jgi:hypothetical protein
MRFWLDDSRLGAATSANGGESKREIYSLNLVKTQGLAELVIHGNDLIEDIIL